MRLAAFTSGTWTFSIARITLRHFALEHGRVSEKLQMPLARSAHQSGSGDHGQEQGGACGRTRLRRRCACSWLARNLASECVGR